MGEANASDLAAFVQGGGLLAFAAAVFFELRALRPHAKFIAESLAVLLDRSARGNRRADTQPPLDGG